MSKIEDANGNAFVFPGVSPNRVDVGNVLSLPLDDGDSVTLNVEEEPTKGWKESVRDLFLLGKDDEAIAEILKVLTSAPRLAIISNVLHTIGSGPIIHSLGLPVTGFRLSIHSCVVRGVNSNQFHIRQCADGSIDVRLHGLYVVSDSHDIYGDADPVNLALPGSTVVLP